MKINVLLKRILPTKVFNFTKNIYKYITYRHMPYLSAFQSSNESVLQCCIAYNDYGGYCVPLACRQRPVTQMILNGKVWEPHTIDYIVANCSDGDIIHAGTFFGDFLPALSRGCATGSKVWAFEPHPENYRCSIVTITINSLDNVNLINVGLGEREEVLQMATTNFKGTELGGAAYVVPKNSNGNLGKTIDVRIIAIDDFFPQDRVCSVIQLDLEGHEQNALIGAIKTITRHRPIIIVETLPEEDWLSRNLWPLGYKIKCTVHHNTVLVCAAK